MNASGDIVHHSKSFEEVIEVHDLNEEEEGGIFISHESLRKGLPLDCVIMYTRPVSTKD